MHSSKKAASKERKRVSDRRGAIQLKVRSVEPVPLTGDILDREFGEGGKEAGRGEGAAWPRKPTAGESIPRIVD